jgi:hypothetical protein
MGHSDAHEVMLEEQLAIFLYTCVTGLTICHIGERFQHANGTISQCAFFLIQLNLFLMVVPWQLFPTHAYHILF